MRAWLVLALLGLVTAGASGSLMDVLGTDAKEMAEALGIKLPSLEEDNGVNPCNITVSADVETATETCIAELTADAPAEEEDTGGRGDRGGKGGRGKGGRGKRSTRTKRRAGRGGRRRGGGRGRGRGGQSAAGPREADVQRCIFEKLELVDDEGNLNKKDIITTIEGYRRRIGQEDHGQDGRGLLRKLGR